VQYIFFVTLMSDLKQYGLQLTCIGKLNGVMTWKITGNTRPYANIFKKHKGFWSCGSWRMSGDNLENAANEISTLAAQPSAKRQKVGNAVELERKKEEWLAVSTSIDAHGYNFIIDEVFNEVLKEKGELAWGPIMSANDAIHSCGCNIVWELFLAANKDIEKVGAKFCDRCYACMEPIFS
jgi:hypothetical protein